MKKRSLEILTALRVLLQMTEEVALTADRCLQPGHRKKRLAVQTAQAMLLEQGIQAPRWVIEAALGLAWRRGA